MTLSPDGNWFWDGVKWIPAPPNEAPETQASTNSGYHQSVVFQNHIQPKSYGTALILNFLWSGFGHIYLEQKGGITMAIIALISILTIFLLPAGLVIWIFCLVKTRAAHNNYLNQNGFSTASSVTSL